MNKYKALYISSRPLNLLIMVLTMIAIQYGVLYPAFKFHKVTDWIQPFTFGILILSIVLLAAGGNIINDILDVEADEINKPGTNLIGKGVSASYALNVYKAMTIGGVLLGLLVSILTSSALVLVNLFIAASLWLYSYKAQKEVLMGNLIIAILVSSLPFIVLQYDIAVTLYPHSFLESLSLEKIEQFILIELHERRQLVYLFMAFAFLSNFAREVIKDLIDEKGDRLVGHRTLPIVHGQKKARGVAAGLIILTMGSYLLFMYRLVFFFISPVLIIAVGLLVFIPLFLSLRLLFSQKKDAQQKASLLLKISMFFGIASAFLCQY